MHDTVQGQAETKATKSESEKPTLVYHTDPTLTTILINLSAQLHQSVNFSWRKDALDVPWMFPRVVNFAPENLKIYSLN